MACVRFFTTISAITNRFQWLNMTRLISVHAKRSLCQRMNLACELYQFVICMENRIGASTPASFPLSHTFAAMKILQSWCKCRNASSALRWMQPESPTVCLHCCRNSLRLSFDVCLSCYHVFFTQFTISNNRVESSSPIAGHMHNSKECSQMFGAEIVWNVRE